MTPPDDPAPASDDSPESDSSPPSNKKIAWALCVLAILVLTIGTTTLIESASDTPGVPLSKGAYPVVAGFWSAVVLGLYYWRSRK